MAAKKKSSPRAKPVDHLGRALDEACAAQERPLPRTLPGCRREIDKVDQAIIALLDRRAQIAGRVGEVKTAKGAQFFDAGRHLSVLNGISCRGSGDFPPEGLRNVFGEILSVCLNLQAPQKIGFLGPAGTFSQIAARRAFGRSPEFLPFLSISDIFAAVDKGRVHFGVVPVENSSGGVVHVTLDELIESDLSICAEVYIPIRHNLLCRGSLGRIRRVCTHPQVLLQCRNWLRANLPEAEQIETASTAEGARRARRSSTTATIGPSLAGEIYNLPVLDRGIEDTRDNVTRFLIIGRQAPKPSGNDRTSIMFSIKDEPGALYHLLKPFSDRKINLTKIESRPTRRRAWDYIFFVDVDGHTSDPKVSRAIDRLRRHCNFLRVLGSYPVDRQRDTTRG